MRIIRVITEAQDDMDAILQYVRSNFGLQAAVRVSKDLLNRIEPLSSMPELGTLAPKLHYKGKPVRIIHSQHTRIIYAVRETEIVILLFWNNQQDDHKLKEILSER